MTRMVFATWGGWGAKADRPRLHAGGMARGVDAVLATRAYPKEITHCTDYARLLPGAVDLWLDSGAFTAWKGGEMFNVKDYVTYIKSILPTLKVFRRVFVISLDKIPGTPGKPVSATEIAAAIDETLNNTQYLLSQGIEVVPIHHQGEPLWVMEQYLKLCEYVGISPANDSPQKTRIAYVRSLIPLFKSEQPIHPAHNFGNTPASQLTQFPMYSADSQTWRMRTMTFGEAFDLQIFGQKNRGRNLITSHRAKQDPITVLLENVTVIKKFESDLQKLWAHRGITWREPKGIDLT